MSYSSSKEITVGKLMGGVEESFHGTVCLCPSGGGVWRSVALVDTFAYIFVWALTKQAKYIPSLLYISGRILKLICFKTTHEYSDYNTYLLRQYIYTLLYKQFTAHLVQVGSSICKEGKSSLNHSLHIQLNKHSDIWSDNSNYFVKKVIMLTSTVVN